MRHPSRQLIPLALALAALILLSFPSAAVQPATPAPQRPASAARKLLHLRLKGDLDCTKLVHDVAAELARARADRVEMLLLELDGNRWRADVVWGIAQEVRALNLPVAAWLHDARDRRVGTGQAALALLVTTLPSSAALESDAPLPPAPIFVDQRTAIVLELGDDLRSAAPEGTDWETIDRELQGAAWVALRLRGVDTELAATLLAPAEEAWAVVEPGHPRPRLTGTRPPLDAPFTQVVHRVGIGAVRVHIDAALAAHLGLSAGAARTPGDVLSALRTTAAPKITRELASGLPKARARVEAELVRIDRALERADRTLRDLPRRSAADFESKRTQAGVAALAALDEAAASIILAEELIADYPELLRINPPTRTPVGEDPTSFRSAWRRLFQDKRDEHAKLAARAREYAGR